MNFTDTIHCRSRLHCRTCRDRVGGRPWRQALAAMMELPGREVDFACPLGLPWGFAGDGALMSRPKAVGCATCGLTAEERRRMADIRSQRGPGLGREAADAAAEVPVRGGLASLAGG